MLRPESKVKIGIYRVGASIKVISELDFITQESGYKDEVIYLSTISFIRDPRLEFTEKDIKDLERRAIKSFTDHRYDFKAKNRKDADTYFKYHINLNKMETLREFGEIA